MKHIICKKYSVRKKFCDIKKCGITICKLHKNNRSDTLALYNIVEEFHVTKNQIKCAVRDGIIHAEIFQRSSQRVMLISKNEVAVKLNLICAYPIKSVEEIKRSRNYKHKIIGMAAESLDDPCTLTEASSEFGISVGKLHIALQNGIIHWRKKGERIGYIVSKTEIRENLDMIKKGSRILYKILKAKKQHQSQEKQQTEIHQQVSAPDAVPSSGLPMCVNSCNLPQKWQEMPGHQVKSMGAN